MEKSTQAPKSHSDVSKKKRLLLQSSLEMRIRDANDPILFGSGEDETPDVQSILELHSKNEIIEFLCDAAVSDAEIFSQIRRAADRDVSHRKVFVHGLPWDVTKETLSQVFSPFGSIDECHVVVDKSSGRCKGYGFVLFETRSGAVKALKEPRKNIGGRTAHCQLASAGPAEQTDTAGRKIYVSNVHPDTDAEKLRGFFSKFGEIEAGPLGFDSSTGKSRGYAIFLYRNGDGARKALEESFKMFEGHRLHCQFAADPAKTQSTASIGASPQQISQNFALYNQISPNYSTILGQNPLLPSSIGVNPSLLGIPGYGINSTILSGNSNQFAAGLHEVQNPESSILQPGNSYAGMRSYMWSASRSRERKKLGCVKPKKSSGAERDVMIFFQRALSLSQVQSLREREV